MLVSSPPGPPLESCKMGEYESGSLNTTFTESIIINNGINFFLREEL
jgi:hypothetical protein